MELQTVPLDQIEDIPAPTNKARQISFLEIGVVEPPKLWLNGSGKYQIIKGRRRIADLKAMGKSDVLALVEEMDSLQAAKESLTDICRSSNYMSEAEDIAKLEQAGYTQKEIATMMGVSQPVISQRSRLLDLIPDLQSKMKTGDMIFSCARVAVRLPVEDQMRLAGMEKPTLQAAMEMLAQYQSAEVDLDNLGVPDVPEDYQPPAVIKAEDMQQLISGEPVTIMWQGEKFTIVIGDDHEHKIIRNRQDSDRVDYC